MSSKESEIKGDHVRRAGRGLVIGLVVGAVVGTAAGQTSSQPLAWILLLGIGGALVNALSALYSGRSMTSTAYGADGSHRATIRITD